MHTQRINISLPNTILRQLQTSIPQGKRSKFIATAISERLKKSNLKQQLRKSARAQREIAKQIEEDFKYADAEIFNKIP